MQLAAGVPDGQVAVLADMGDRPPVAVLDPVGGGESESAVVATGDDHISDTGQVPVGQTHLRVGSGVVETMRPGTAVEFGDKLPGGGEHDRVQPGSSVGNPSTERILGRRGEVADMNTAVIKIELERRRVAFAEGE